MGDQKPREEVRRPAWRGLVFLAAGLLFFGWLLSTPSGLLGKADAVGYAVCHQISERTFHIFERPMPLCARCSGMYLGALAGLAFQAMTAGRRSAWPSLKLLAVFALMVAAFGFDGVNSFLHLIGMDLPTYEPNNLFRLITGTGMGLAISATVFPSFNQTAWADEDDRPAVGSWRSLGGMLLSGAVMVALVLTGSSTILYPLALASAATVVLLLTMVYTVIWLMLLRQENRFHSLRQMILPLTGGFLFAMMQIAALDAIRFLLTGTWEGFTFG
jgi:uncharacterized membrane protein